MTALRGSMCFYIKFTGPTNHTGARVAIRSYDLLRKKMKIKYSRFDYSASSSVEQAMKELVAFGFEPIAINTRNPEIDIVMVKFDWDLLAKFYNHEVKHELSRLD